jgi:hypothetical protein
MTALDQAEIDGVLLHIKGLIFARALLEERGASESDWTSTRPSFSVSVVASPNSSESRVVRRPGPWTWPER